MDNSISQNAQHIYAKMKAQQRKIQSVLERQRRRDVAAAQGKVIPFDENDILIF